MAGVCLAVIGLYNTGKEGNNPEMPGKLYKRGRILPKSNPREIESHFIQKKDKNHGSLRHLNDSFGPYWAIFSSFHCKTFDVHKSNFPRQIILISLEIITRIVDN